ncbi:MAG: LptF/LptG family permease, partial [Alphaproteobacteria bacterium]|nr:LptF/LptG family permease [Alphaproteobacteria bacterium]
IERKYLKSQEGNMISVIDSGLYIFESLDHKNRIITAKIILKNEEKIKNVTILNIDDNNNFIDRIESLEAQFSEFGITLSQDAYVINAEGKKHSLDSLTLPTKLSFATIIKKFEFPENISFWRLGGLALELSRSGINADKFVSYYFKLLLRPLYCMALILFSFCFAYTNVRGVQQFKIIGYGVVTGLCLHGAKEVTSIVLMSEGIGAFFAQLIPIVIIALISLIAIVRLFEFNR